MSKKVVLTLSTPLGDYPKGDYKYQELPLELVKSFSVTISHLNDDIGDDGKEVVEVPVPGADIKVLNFLNNFFQKAQEFNKDKDYRSVKDLDEKEKKLFEGLTIIEIYDILKTSNFLDINLLTEMTSKHLAEIIRQNQDDLFKLFDCTPPTEEEQKEVKKMHPWANPDIKVDREVKDSDKMEE